MAYRRDGKDTEKRWRKTNRHRLVEAGVPDFILDDARLWNYVLLHGDELDSGWDTSWLTREQCRRLLGLLSTFYTNEVGLDLFANLRRRLGDASDLSTAMD